MTNVKHRKSLFHRMKKDRAIYLFILPGVFFYLLFSYVPLYGIIVAFKDFRITRGILDSPWAGVKYFELLWTMPGFWDVVVNTVLISFYKIIFSFPAPKQYREQRKADQGIGRKPR